MPFSNFDSFSTRIGVMSPIDRKMEIVAIRNYKTSGFFSSMSDTHSAMDSSYMAYHNDYFSFDSAHLNLLKIIFVQLILYRTLHNEQLIIEYIYAILARVKHIKRCRSDKKNPEKST